MTDSNDKEMLESYRGGRLNWQLIFVVCAVITRGATAEGGSAKSVKSRFTEPGEWVTANSECHVQWAGSDRKPTGPGKTQIITSLETSLLAKVISYKIDTKISKHISQLWT